MNGTSDLLAVNGGMPFRRDPFRWPLHDTTERQLLLEVLESGHWAYEGPKERGFTEEFARYLDVPHAFAVSSGTTALEVAVNALGVGPGDEVIVPALTWTAPARAIAISGAVPRFVDISANDWCLDVDAVKAAINRRTRAIVVVHTYSQVADMDRILPLANAAGLAVIEDCAHAIGSEWRGRKVGSLGMMGCFSFQQSKAMTAGEGGLVVTTDEQIADRIYSGKNCGRPRNASSPMGFGGNYRMTEFQAAILNSQLGRLDEQISHRAANISAFETAARRVPGVQPLGLRTEVTQRSLFALSLGLDRRWFADQPLSTLVSVLAAEGVPIFLPHNVVYQSPLWTSGAREPTYNGGEPGARLGLSACCPVAERISAEGGIVVTHEAFLGTSDDAVDVAGALAKVQRLASTIVRDVQDQRQI